MNITDAAHGTAIRIDNDLVETSTAELASLGRTLLDHLLPYAGDGGHTESAVECLDRLIKERNEAQALLTAMRQFAKEFGL